MKKFLEELGIYTVNDLICNIGGFLVIVFVTLAVISFGYYVYFEIPSWLYKSLGVNIALIVLCFIADKNTQ